MTRAETRQTARGCLVAHWRVDLLEHKAGSRLRFGLGEQQQGLHTGSGDGNQEEPELRSSRTREETVIRNPPHWVMGWIWELREAGTKGASQASGLDDSGNEGSWQLIFTPLF